MNPKHKVCLESNMLLKKKEKQQQKNRLYTFPQSNKLGRLCSYSGHATFLCSNRFYILWTFKSLCNINLYLMSNFYVSMNELSFWSHSDVIGTRAWLRQMIKLNRFWLEMDLIWVPVGLLLRARLQLYQMSRIVCVHQQCRHGY